MLEWEWLKFLWAPVVAVLGYFVKKRDDDMAALKKDLKDSARELDGHKLHVAENYVKNHQLALVIGSMNRVEDRLNKVYDLLVQNNQPTPRG